MRTRRELLAIGGAGAAALTVPSIFPNFGGTALAQGNPADPIVGELGRQFQAVVRGLGATPPRGNAHQLAALFRMTAAWARSNNIDAQVRQKLDTAIATEGHQALVARFAARDRAAEGRARGLPVPPNVRNYTEVELAKAIGWYKAGMTIERACLTMASTINRHAATFNNRMAVLNNIQPGAIIRRVQDVDSCIANGGDAAGCQEAYPPTDGCTQSSDGSFSCTLVYNPSPPDPGCSWVEWTFWMTGGALIEMMMAMFGLGRARAMAIGYSYESWMWYIRCS